MHDHPSKSTDRTIQNIFSFATLLLDTRQNLVSTESARESGVLQRSAPPMISSSKLRCLGRVCGLPDLSDTEEEAVA